MESLVASRELRNNTRSVLDRVQAGEVIVITVDGREVARMTPVDRRSHWMPKAEFVAAFLDQPLDRSLYDELREMLPDTTDDLPYP